MQSEYELLITLRDSLTHTTSLCYCVSMKTISLTEVAYGRLLEWKESQKDSFSAVVLRRIPKRGTLGDVLASTQDLPTLTDKQFKVMEDSVKWQRAVPADGNPWNT